MSGSTQGAQLVVAARNEAFRRLRVYGERIDESNPDVAYVPVEYAMLEVERVFAAAMDGEG